MMDCDLDAAHVRARARYRHFADEDIAPLAAAIDRDEAIPRALVGRMAAEGLFHDVLRQEDGGVDPVSLGLLCEACGRASSSVRSLLTVQGMVAQAIGRWGSCEQRHTWLPLLGDGRAIAAFALTEPNVGSDANAVETTAIQHGSRVRLRGVKKWISFAQIADVFLVVVRLDDCPTAVLVERQTAGLSVEPIQGMLGDRGAMLGTVSLDDCELPVSAIVGRPGLGISPVTSTALDSGRFTVAWGCVGIAQACLDAAVHHAAIRRQFGTPIGDHQLIRRLLAQMHVEIQAARLLCLQAARRRGAGDPQSVVDSLVAKYYSSTVASQCATHAVQIHGALGCSRETAVERCFRDARVTEIIEGSTQIQELLIGQHVLQAGAVEAIPAVPV